MKLRLKAIRFNCDFRKSEWTNYGEFRKHKSYPGDLRVGECFLFVSQGEDQMIWFLNTSETERDKGNALRFVDSRRWRIIGGAWNPKMLSEYAKAMDLEMINIKSFAVQYEEERERKRLARIAAALEEKREKKRNEALEKDLGRIRDSREEPKGLR